MNHARLFRMLLGGLAATLIVVLAGTSAAEAKPPPKSGGVTNLTGSAAAGSVAGSYDVISSWDPAKGATSYRVALTKGGSVLASATVVTTSWNPTVAAAPGVASLTVRPVAGHRKGSTSTTTFNLPAPPDVTAPQGIYTTSWVNATKVATLTEASLTDDSPTSQVTRVVDWGDGTGTVGWSDGLGFPTDALLHTYTKVGRFVPTITLTDASSNERVVTAPAVVIDDVAAPTGSFTAAPGTAWSSLTTVTFTPSGLVDDNSPAANITVSVDWGDGTAPVVSTGFASISHVYAAAGSFTPKMTLTDEADNASLPITASTVMVKTDKVAPVVTLLLPKMHQHSVKVWKLLRGKATDTAGTGVSQVRIRAVQKRGTKWFGYRPATKRWVRSATRAMAFKKSRTLNLTTTNRHRWSATLAGLRKGTLIYKVWAVDGMQNVSKPMVHRATLAKP
jgi:hypothetical protein